MYMENEHGYCPSCNADLDGAPIWKHFYEEFTIGKGYWKDVEGEYLEERRLLSVDEARLAADLVAEQYGATRNRGKFSRKIGIEYGRDRVEDWRCPDCHYTWPRKRII